MKNLKKLLVMLFAMTLTLAFVGCGTKNTGSNSNAQNSGTNQEATTETTEESTEDASQTMEVTYPVDITDSNETTVTIEAVPEKIVSIAPNITELLFQLGYGDHLVGRTDYCDSPEEVSAIPSIGSMSTPDIEAIIALEPDLVLVSTHFDEENVKKLKDLGITVVSLYEEHDIYGVYTMIETLGTIVNQVAKANELVQDMKDTFDEVATEVAGQEQPTVYYVVGYGDGGDYTAGGDTFMNGLIEFAGGINVAKDVSGWSISLESLLEADPDVIITGVGMAEDFKANDNYKNMTAVKEGRVYEMDGYHLFDRQGYRNAEGVKELAKILYPELVK